MRPLHAWLALQFLVLAAACDADEARTSSESPTTLGNDGNADADGEATDASSSDAIDTTDTETSNTEGGPHTCSSDDECSEGEYCLVDTCTEQWWSDCPAGAEVSVAVGYRDVGAPEHELEVIYDQCVSAVGTIIDAGIDANTMQLTFDVRPNLAPFTNSRLVIGMPAGTWAENPIVLVDGEPAALQWSDENPALPSDFPLAFYQATGELTRVEYEEVGNFTIVGVTFEGTLVSTDKAADLVVDAHLVIEN